MIHAGQISKPLILRFPQIQSYIFCKSLSLTGVFVRKVLISLSQTSFCLIHFLIQMLVDLCRTRKLVVNGRCWLHMFSQQNRRDQHSVLLKGISTWAALPTQLSNLEAYEHTFRLACFLYIRCAELSCPQTGRSERGEAINWASLAQGSVLSLRWVYFVSLNKKLMYIL